MDWVSSVTSPCPAEAQSILRARSNCPCNLGCDGPSARFQISPSLRGTVFVVHPYPKNPPSGKNAQATTSNSCPIVNRASRRPDATSHMEKPSGEVWSALRSSAAMSAPSGEKVGVSIRPGSCRCCESVLRRRRPRVGGPRSHRSWPEACRRARGPLREGVVWGRPARRHGGARGARGIARRTSAESRRRH